MLLLGPDIVSNQFTAFVKGIADLILIPEALKFDDGSSVKKDWKRIISTF